MKKYNFLKIISLGFLAVFLLTWIIPAGSYASGVFTSGETSPLGLLDLVRIPLSTISSFAQYTVLFLFIGGLYGVMNATLVYTKVVNYVVNGFKKDKQKFLLLSMLVFTVLASLTALKFALFLLVPFFITVLLLLGYSKITSLMATVGSILVGTIGSTYGFDVNGYINYYLELNTHDSILIKVIFFTVITSLFMMFVVKGSKLGKASTNIPLYSDEKESKKGFMPLVVVFDLLVLVSLIAMFNWQYAFEFEFFNDLYTDLMESKIYDYPLFSNLLGTVNPFGYFSIYELSMMIVIASLLIGWLYNLKIDKIISSFIDGAKEMLPVAIYVTLANIILVVIASSTGNIYFTMVDYILGLTDSFNAFTMGLVAVLGGLFYNDFTNLFGTMGPNLTVLYLDNSWYSIMGLVFQTMHGLVMLFVPTSLILVAGLTYLEIPYLEYLKYIWRLALQIFLASLVMIIILTMFV